MIQQRLLLCCTGSPKWNRFIAICCVFGEQGSVLLETFKNCAVSLDRPSPYEKDLTMFSPKKNVSLATRSALVLSAALSCAAIPAIAQNCSIIDLGRLPGATVTLANGINNNGQIVGVSGPHAFLYDSGTMKDLGTLGGATSYAYGINLESQIIGYADTAAGTTHAFLSDHGTMTDLGTLGGSNSYAYGINDLGQIVGQSQTASGSYHAFLYQGGSMTDLGSLPGDNSIAYRINNSGQIVGSSYINATDFHPFLYDNGVMKDLGVPAGMVDGEAFSINAGGTVVGYSENADASMVRGLTYDSGTLNNLGTLGANASFASDINEAGNIVGYSTLLNGNTHSLLFEPTITYDLGTLPKGTFSYALGINANNLVVGFAGDSKGNAQAFKCQARLAHDED